MNFLSFIKDNTGLFLVFLLIYLGAGIAWSFYRLRLSGKKENKAFLEKKRKFLEDGHNEDEWIAMAIDGRIRKPEFKTKKSRIFSWITYWPLSLFWYLCHDVIEDILEKIYDLFKDLYQKVYENAIGDILCDFKKADEKVATMMSEPKKKKESKRRGFDDYYPESM